MSYLIDELREEAKLAIMDECPISAKTYSEAADELERLQARVEALEEVVQAVCDTKQVCQFETRLQKLAREALAATEQ